MTAAVHEEYAQCKAQWIKDHFGFLNTRESILLDVGCHTGSMTYYLQELFFNTTVIGYDINSAAIDSAQTSHPSITFTSNLQSLQEHSIDLIIIADVMHHIASTQQASLIASLQPYLKPQGWLIIIEPNVRSKQAKKSFYAEQEHTNLSMFDIKKIRSMFPTKTWNICIDYVNHSSWLQRYIPSWILKKIPIGETMLISAQNN